MLAQIHTGLSDEARAVADPVLNALTFLASNASVGVRAGQWRYSFARQGMTLALTDAIIAATVAEWNATVVTGNAKDYPMPELSLLPIARRTLGK